MTWMSCLDNWLPLSLTELEPAPKRTQRVSGATRPEAVCVSERWSRVESQDTRRRVVKIWRRAEAVPSMRCPLISRRAWRGSRMQLWSFRVVRGLRFSFHGMQIGADHWIGDAVFQIISNAQLVVNVILAVYGPSASRTLPWTRGACLFAGDLGRHANQQVSDVGAQEVATLDVACLASWKMFCA